MSSFSVNLNQAARQFDALNQEILVAARKGLVLAAARGLQKIVVEIIPRRIPTPVDRGIYRAGWKLKVVDQNSVEIFNDEPVAVFVEEGVRGQNVKIGRALLEALASWAMRKGMASGGQQAMQVAWAIARNMQKNGIFNNRGPYKNGLGILRELVDHHIEDLMEAEIIAAVGRV